MSESKFGPEAFSQGDVMRRLRRVEAEISQLRTSRRLESATIGQGGLTVRGGAISIYDLEGNQTMRLASGELVLEGELDVTGTITSRDPDTNRYVRLKIGQVTLVGGVEGELEGRIFGGDAGGGRPTVQLVPPRLQGPADSNRIIVEGDNPTVPGGAIVLVTGGPTELRSGGHVLLIPDPASNLGAQIANTTNAANLNIGGTDANGIFPILRVTSSSAYKLDVEDLEIDPEEILSLKPRTWRDRGEVESNPDTDRWHVGLIAEEVDEAGLTEFVDYTEEGKPQSVTYDRLSVGLLSVIKQQQERIEALEEKLGAAKKIARKKTPRKRKGKRRSFRKGTLPTRAI